MYKLFYFCVALILSTTVLIADNTIVRAGIDVGSGGLKVTVASVNPNTQTIDKIHFSNEYDLPLKHDMEVTGVDRLSEEMQELAVRTLTKIQQDLSIYQPVEWAGIATAASRRASNAKDLYDRVRTELGINIAIIPQVEGGRIGFITATAVSGLPKERLIAYDSGSGSFQLTTEIDGQLEVVEGDVAFIAALSTLVKGVRHKQLDHQTSPNPIRTDEAKEVVCLLQKNLPTLSDAFSNKLRDSTTTVIGIGNQNFIFATAAMALGKSTYTKEELWGAIEAHCNLSDDQLTKFAKPCEAVIGMILLYSVMDGLKIDQLTYSFANGSCEGLLVDPNYWTSNANAPLVMN